MNQDGKSFLKELVFMSILRNIRNNQIHGRTQSLKRTHLCVMHFNFPIQVVITFIVILLLNRQLLYRLFQLFLNIYRNWCNLLVKELWLRFQFLNVLKMLHLLLFYCFMPFIKTILQYFLIIVNICFKFSNPFILRVNCCPLYFKQGFCFFHFQS